MPDIQGMSVTEETDEDFQYSQVKADAGCTPKLSRRKSVASGNERSVTEILSKRNSRLLRTSSSASSWLHAIKKSSVIAKNVVEKRKKVQLQVDAAPCYKVLEYNGCRHSADSNKSEATSLYFENKITSSHAQLKVFVYCCSKSV